MSLINDMLRDLDRRKRRHNHETMHTNIGAGNPLSALSAFRPTIVAAATFIFLAGMTAGYVMFTN